VVDDNQLEKKNRTVNEPVQFLVGRTKLRYELVVNDVQKDKIVGYLSTPKDKGYPPKDCNARLPIAGLLDRQSVQPNRECFSNSQLPADNLGCEPPPPIMDLSAFPSPAERIDIQTTTAN
jgi:hypothetical protein